MGESKKFQKKRRPYDKPRNPQDRTRKPVKIVSLRDKDTRKPNDYKPNDRKPNDRKPYDRKPYDNRKPIVESPRLSDLVKKTNLNHKGKNLNDLILEQKTLMNDFDRMERDVDKIKKRPSYKENKELAIVPYRPYPQQASKLPLVPYLEKPLARVSKKTASKKKKKKTTKKKTPKKVCTNQTKTVVYQKKKTDGSKDKYYEMRQVYRKCQKVKPKKRKPKPRV